MADPVSFTLMTVAQIGVNYLFPSEGPRIKDMKMTASTYGAAIPNSWGACRVAGNVIWSTPIKEKKRRRGKGGSSIEYTYSCTYAAAFCAGPITMFRKIWADGKLIYDASGKSPIQSNSKYSFTFYLGTEDQLPNSSIEADVGIGQTPAFRGLAYVVFDNFPLTDFSNRLPQLTAEVVTNGSGSVGFSVSQFGGDTFYSNSHVVGSIGTEVREYYTVTGGFSDGSENEFIAITGPNGTYLIENPENPLTPQLGFQVTEAIWDEFDPGILIFFSTDNFRWACKWSRAQNTIKWQKAVPVYFAGRGNIKYGEYAAILQEGDLPSYYQTVWMIDTTTGLWKNRSGMPPANEATYSGMPVTYTGEIWAYDDQYWDSYNNCVVSVGGSGGTPHITYLTPGTQFLEGIRLRRADGTGFGSYQTGRFWIDFNRGHLYVLAVSGLERYIKRFRMSDGVLDKTITQADLGSGLYTILEIAPGTGDLLIACDLSNSIPLGLVDGDSYKTRFTSGVSSNSFSNPWPPVFDHPSVSAISQDEDGRTSILYRGLFGEALALNLNPGGSFTTLEDIVRGLLTKAELSSTQMDLTQLQNKQVLGYGFARGTDIKSILEELRRVYLFDIVESDGKLVAVMRGGDESFANSRPDAVITQDVLGSSTPDATDFWQTTRAQDADVPAQIELGYLNYNNDYNSGVARSQRTSNPLPAMYSRQKVSMELNLVMTPDSAKEQARKMLYAQWAERTQHSTRLPWAYLNLDPADLIKVDMNDGRTFNDRLHSMEYGADGSIEVQTYSQDNGAYEQIATGDGGPEDGQTIVEPIDLTTFVINTPLLRDMDDSNGSYSVYYSGMGRALGETGDFVGGSMWRSLNSLDYDFLYGTDVETTWGTVTGTVPQPSRGNFALDWETTITITPRSSEFELHSISDDELWAGGNPCKIGEEVMQFRDVVENLNGSWTISNLLRGRRGTEYACDTHVSGETFIMLDIEALAIQGDVLDSRGQNRFFKSVGQEGDFDDADAIEISYEPRDLMPYAPSDIRREITSAGTVELTWKRRTRTGGGLVDYTGTVPLREAEERYEVYILSAPFSGDLSRGNAPTTGIIAQFETTTPLIEWEPASSGFDPFLDTIHVCIYQLSSAVGRGFPGTRSIEPWDDF